MKHRPGYHACTLASLAALLAMASPLRGQAQRPASDPSILQRRYEAAQKFQAQHDLVHARDQYRIFLADTLGELAIGEVRAGQYDKAQDNFDEALTLVPDFPMMQLEYARAALRSGHLQHAQLLTRVLIQRYPGNVQVQPAAHALLGRIFLKLNKDNDAKAEFEQAVALDPTFENGYELAVSELDLGDEDGASKIFAEMLKSFGDTAEIHLYFGQAFGNSDFQPRAIDEFSKAIAKNDRLPGVHYSLAAAYLASSGNSKAREAEAELRKEISISPSSASAYAALGHMLAGPDADASRSAEGEADLRRATLLDPIGPDAFLYLGQYYAQKGKASEAEAALRKAIALTTDVSRNGFQVRQAHYQLGRLLLQQGKKEEGGREIATASQLQQQNLTQAQERLSDYLEDKQTRGENSLAMPMRVDQGETDPKAAEQAEAFRKKMTAAIADSYNNLGAISGSLEEHHAALTYFRRAAEWQPTLPGLDLNWGRAAFEDAAFSEALAPLRRYLAAHPGGDKARAMLGLAEFQLQDYATARHTLQPIVDSGSAQAPALQCAYAQSLMLTGNPQEASKRLAALASANSGDPTCAVPGRSARRP